MEPLVSIIIPVYNAQQTIERCLCSIRNQTFDNFEVLMVNDGSHDHSMRILEKFASLDPRFIIIDKSNSGVSDSRNIAMDCACGKYFQFVDADDWIPSDAVESLVNAAEKNNSDMVICDYRRVIGHMFTTKGHIDVSGTISKRTYAEYMMKAPANYYYGVMWNKFYRADLIRAHRIKCPLAKTSSLILNFFNTRIPYMCLQSRFIIMSRPKAALLTAILTCARPSAPSAFCLTTTGDYMNHLICTSRTVSDYRHFL